MRPSSLLIPWLAAALILTGCHKAPAPKTGKAVRAENSARQTQERQATEAFASAMRSVIEWRQTLPVPQNQAARAAAIRELSKRFQSVPTQGLPSEILPAWEHLQQVCQKLGTLLAAPAPPSSAEVIRLQTEGREAGEKLNQWLHSQGFGELHF